MSCNGDWMEKQNIRQTDDQERLLWAYAQVPGILSCKYLRKENCRKGKANGRVQSRHSASCTALSISPLQILSKTDTDRIILQLHQLTGDQFSFKWTQLLCAFLSQTVFFHLEIPVVVGKYNSFSHGQLYSLGTARGQWFLKGKCILWWKFVKNHIIMVASHTENHERIRESMRWELGTKGQPSSTTITKLPSSCFLLLSSGP